MKFARFFSATILIISELFYLANPSFATVRYNVLNVGQKGGGGFFVLDGGGGLLAKNYVGGGAVNVYWRDFEPQEGVYKWDLLIKPLATQYHSYWERTICEMCKSQCLSQPRTCRSACSPDNPGPRPTDCANCRYYNPQDCTQIGFDPIPGKVWYDANDQGKTVRFRLMIDQGAMPLWLYGGTAFDGRKVQSSYGTICHPGIICHPDTDIAITSMWPIDAPSNQGFVSPVWWNQIFQEKLRATLMVIGNRIENDPVLSRSVEFVEAAVGNFGEMILYSKWDSPGVPSGRCGVDYLWKHVGYTNKVYGDGVLNLLSIYTEAFPNHHVALSLGNGLYAGKCDDGSTVDQVEKYVLEKAMERWGGRIYLKFSGFGSTYNGEGNRYTTDFAKYCPSTTKCIYEDAGGIDSWRNIETGAYLFDKGNHTCDIDGLKRALSGATQDHAYILMMWYEDWSFIGSVSQQCALYVDNAFQETAAALGSQFILQNVTFSKTTVKAGEKLRINWAVQNASENTLVKFARVGEKDVIGSYPLYFDLVDNNRKIVFKTTYIPTKGTNFWVNKVGGAIVVNYTSDNITIPLSVKPGVYTPRVGIILDDRENKLWALAGRDSTEGNGPYAISSPITITEGGYSFKKGWNSFEWSISQGVTVNQLMASCPKVSKFKDGKFSSFISGYGMLPTAGELNGIVRAKCN